MNFIFISPNFPHTYWQFCDRLKRNGVNVLGIGDAAYEALEEPLRNALTEYYRVDFMEDYDQMLRAVGYFTFRYGKIDWIESNNEYWLEQDARLRTDFHITTGIQADEIGTWKHKSSMKPVYRSAGIPTARCHQVSTPGAAQRFLSEIGGYPVIAKPDVGVGAANTYKIEDDAGFEAFFAEKKCVTIFPFVAWPETMVAGRNTLSAADAEEILSKLHAPQTIDPAYLPFGDGHAAEKIVKALEEYHS